MAGWAMHRSHILYNVTDESIAATNLLLHSVPLSNFWIKTFTQDELIQLIIYLSVRLAFEQDVIKGTQTAMQMIIVELVLICIHRQ